MIGSLKGLPGKAKAIYDYLTTHLASARAAKIENLDAAISSRAAASSALSNTTWTDALAAILGNTIQTSAIKSIQTGVRAYTEGTAGDDGCYADVTISAVTVEKCLVIVSGAGTSSAPDRYMSVMARLTSSTNLRLSSLRLSSYDNYALGARWTVVEFK